MTDNRATERMRALLDERGVEYKETNSGNTTIFNFDYCEQCDDYLHTIAITGACISAYLDYLEPKQAIAATLGSEPDEIELTQTYDVGFRNGVMAVYQQLEGIEDYEELQELIAEYWGEGEGNDEQLPIRR